MGCCQSNCMRDCKPDVEIRMHSRQKSFGEVLLARPGNKNDNPSIFIKNYVDQIPDLAKMIPKEKTPSVTTGPTEDSFKKSKFTEGTDNYNTNATETPFDLQLLDMQLRIGKTTQHLNKEFDAIVESLKSARKDLMKSGLIANDASMQEKFFSVIGKWRTHVYEEVCKKSGEIKHMVKYCSSGKKVTIAHEIDGWNEISILRDFCHQLGMKGKDLEFKLYEDKISLISSLTIIIWIELLEVDSKYSINVGSNISKPEEKRTLRRFLEGSCERENIITWFNANTPVPVEFGFSVGDGDSELITGFYFFDGPAYMNLSKSLSAFQAYGADISPEYLEVFKNIPGEELKVFFLANKDGVQKVQLFMFKLGEELEKEILGKLEKNAGAAYWKFKNSFHQITLRSYYVLEFSCDGFRLSCCQEVGDEISSSVYMDEY